MSKKHYYTARRVYELSVGVSMPGTQYVLTVEEAQKLRDSLDSALREFVMQNEGKAHGCHDCGEERYPKVIHGTLICPECFSDNIVCIDAATTTA